MRDIREVRIEQVQETDVDTILAEDINFSGVLSFQKPLMIKGTFQGEIKASSDLYIGEKAVVKAKIEAGTVSSRGRIEGDVVAHSRVEFFSTASMVGDLATPDLVMESGCQYNGRCTMRRDKIDKADRADKTDKTDKTDKAPALKVEAQR